MEIYNFNINKNPYEVKIISIKGNLAEVEVNGILYDVDLEDVGGMEIPLLTKKIKTQAKQGQTIEEKKSVQTSSVVQPLPQQGGANVIVSPMPGQIFKILVSNGEKIKNGDIVIIIEAMKMENQIRSSKDGVISKVHVNEGEVVPEGALLITLED
jgi:biotin carboxyl carrier protein